MCVGLADMAADTAPSASRRVRAQARDMLQRTWGVAVDDDVRKLSQVLPNGAVCNGAL